MATLNEPPHPSHSVEEIIVIYPHWVHWANNKPYRAVEYELMKSECYCLDGLHNGANTVQKVSPIQAEHG